MSDIENSLVVGLDRAVDNYNKRWPVDEETGEEVPECSHGVGPCTGCGRCEPRED